LELEERGEEQRGERCEMAAGSVSRVFAIGAEWAVLAISTPFKFPTNEFGHKSLRYG
jgi:hypothetical protein